MADVGKHIVVGVDDDFRIRESIESLVESAGYTPLVFSSGEEFLKSGALRGAICVITDVRMPGMDGIELQRRIKGECPKLPVIFISAHYDDETRRRALNEGAVEFLYKPFDATDLLNAIEAALTNAPQEGAVLPEGFQKE
jgi:FixJ family two-component response regulator